MEHNGGGDAEPGGEKEEEAEDDWEQRTAEVCLLPQLDATVPSYSHCSVIRIDHYSKSS